jgi:putative oxidoreductase
MRAGAKNATLLTLRVTMGFLMIWSGLNKIVSVDLSMTISENFYFGLFSSGALLEAFGVFQAAPGALVVVGLFRRMALPLLAAMRSRGSSRRIVR